MLIPEPDLLHFDIAGEKGAHRLACYRWGNREAKRTLLCVHGLTRNGRDFDFLAAKLAEDFQVLCPDMAGRGKSQWLSDPAGYTNPAYVADVMVMLAALGIKRVTWIGTSMGGIMGLMAANMHPGLIEALVLNDIGCLIPANGLARIREIANLPTCYGDYAQAEIAFRKRCENFGIRDETQWQHLLKHGLENRNGQWCFTYDPAIFTVGFSPDAPLNDVNLWPLWEAVAKIPTLVIRGSESDILLRETLAEMQSSHPRMTSHEIAGTGHAPALMDNGQIGMVREWVNGL